MCKLKIQCCAGGAPPMHSKRVWEMAIYVTVRPARAAGQILHKYANAPPRAVPLPALLLVAGGILHHSLIMRLWAMSARGPSPVNCRPPAMACGGFHGLCGLLMSTMPVCELRQHTPSLMRIALGGGFQIPRIINSTISSSPRARDICFQTHGSAQQALQALRVGRARSGVQRLDFPDNAPTKPIQDALFISLDVAFVSYAILPTGSPRCSNSPLAADTTSTARTCVLPRFKPSCRVSPCCLPT